jgi:SAM-dependent methyltransferase
LGWLLKGWRRVVATGITATPTGGVEDEHYIPAKGFELEAYLQAGDANGVHHLIRYLWARECALDEPRPTSILDLACGSGYGTHLLASSLPQATVVGVDYDAKAVRRAKSMYSRSNLSFRLGDVVAWEETIGGDTFDLITSFDTIEHVNHREIMLENLVGHLRRSGRLLLSTPCGGDVVIPAPSWEYHKIEYSAGSLYDFLRRYFSEVLRPEDGALPHLEVFERLRLTPVSYLLRMNPVVCRGPIVIENPYPSTAERTRGKR